MLISTPRRLLVLFTALALIVGVLAPGGPAAADEHEPSGPGAASSSAEPPADDDPPPGSVSSSVPTIPSSSVPSSSTTSSSPASSSEPPPTTGPHEGALNLRAVEVTTGADIVGVPVRVFRHDGEVSESTMPGAFWLPSGKYRVTLIAIPAGYRLVSPWALHPVVPAQSEVTATFRFAPISGPRGRVPIKTIPSGRTQ